MIDTLPLDLFGDGEDDAATMTCPWCEAVVAVGSTTCTACGARIAPAPPPEPTVDGTLCQWCGMTIAPEIDTCPGCGWDARGESEIEIPGITTPLSDADVRTLYDDDENDDDSDLVEAAYLVGGIINLLLRD